MKNIHRQKISLPINTYLLLTIVTILQTEAKIEQKNTFTCVDMN